MDVRLSERFLDDYDCLPRAAQKVLDRWVKTIPQVGWFPPNANAHQMHGLEQEIWSASVTRKRESYRLLFYVQNDTLIFDRVMKHDRRDLWLKT